MLHKQCLVNIAFTNAQIDKMISQSELTDVPFYLTESSFIGFSQDLSAQISVWTCSVLHDDRIQVLSAEAER